MHYKCIITEKIFLPYLLGIVIIKPCLCAIYDRSDRAEDRGIPTALAFF